jgi:hypothetical protein
MAQEYFVLTFGANDSDAIQQRLSEASADGWRLVTSWTAPGSPNINKGEMRVHFLLDKSR